MDADTRAKAEMLLKSGKMSPEDAEALRAALQAEPAEPGVDPNEARAQRLEAAQRTFEEETSPGTLTKGVASGAWERLKAMGEGAIKLGDIMNPIGQAGRNLLRGKSPTDLSAVDLAKRPEARRELGRGLSDTMLGIPERIADSVGEPTYRNNAATDPGAAPGYRAAGQIAGSVTPGSATNLIGRGSLALATRAGLSPALTALAASQLASGTTAGARAALDTGDAGEAGTDALLAAGDPLNLIAPAGVKVAQKAGQAGRAVASTLRDETSGLGEGADTLKTLDQMRERGAVTGNLRRKVNDPELKALPTGKKGYVKAAQGARDTILKNSAAELQKARADYGQQFEAIAAEHGDMPYSMEGPQAKLDQLRAANMVNGEAVDDALAGALDKAQRMITKKSPIIAPGDTNASNARESTVADMLKVKRAMDTKAEWGTPATPENRPYRTIARAFAEQAEGLDPRIKTLNAKYKATMDKLEETNDILGQGEVPEAADRPAARRRAASTIMKTGDDTTAGALAEENLDRLGQLDPRNERALRVVKEKKALERTRFGLPRMSKSPEKWAGSLLEQNLEATKARVVDPLARTLAAMGLDPVTQMLIRARLAAEQQQ